MPGKLVLSRLIGETVVIARDVSGDVEMIEVTLEEIKGVRAAKISFSAPERYSILRKEILETVGWKKRESKP